MTRAIVFIVALFHLFGTVGVPVVAYRCDESGEVGVVSVLSWSPGSCFVDTCCEDESPREVCLECEDSCCDFDIELTLQNSRIMTPIPKFGPSAPPAVTPLGFDASLSAVHLPVNPQSMSAFHPSINLPLLS